VSIVDLDRLSSADIIAQYVIHCKPAGMCLSFAEYQLIDTWLTAIDDNDELLLLILSELLPKYYEGQSPYKRQSSLQFFHKNVMKKIAEIKSRL
jgi:hypothetical protein